MDFTHIEPASLAGAVATILSENESITAITHNRILDYDPRESGWDLTPDNVIIYNPAKKIMTTIVVDDNGGAPAFGGPTEASSREVYIWVMTGATINGAREVPFLMDIIRKYLINRQVFGGPMLTWTFTTGPGPTGDGFMGRMTYRVNGVFA